MRLRRRERSGPRKLTLLLLAVFLLFQSHAPAQVKEVRRVLILNVLGPLSSPGVALMDEAIVAGLERSPYQIELYTEDMEATLFPDEVSQRQFREWYIHKYRDRMPDVIIAVGLEPLRFMVESHEKSFPGVPIVFCGLTEEMLDELNLDSHFTGVWSVSQPEETLKAALALQPGTKHVVVVGGVGAYDRHLEAIARNSFRKYESRLEFTYLTDLGMPALIERLKHLPDHSIVYHTSIMQDADGTRFIDAHQSVPLVAGAAHAPVFVVDDVDLGKGTVGGYLLSFAVIGQTAAQMTVRVLNGERPQDIPVVKSANVYMFDWRALHRWGLKERDLPPGSVVLNRQPTVWESYKWYIIGGVTLIVLEALLIFALLWQRAGRRKAEKELAITYDRFHQAVEAGKSVGWDWDVKTGRDRWFGDLQTMFGIQSDTYCGDVSEFRRRIYPEDRELVWKAVAEARQNRKPYIAEFRIVRNDGTVHWITARGQFYYAANGDAERMLGMAVDITDRKLAEESLATMGRRLIEAHEEERTWIARELHDDVNQRIALVAIELERWSQHLPESAVDLHDHIHHARQRLSDISKDIQALSHRLHSSKLEYLGIVAAANSYCKELSEQHKVRVEFSHSDIPRTLPMEISVCLFRVLQEALQNAVKHSGAQHFSVDLRGTTEEIRLTVSDAGVGFDWQSAIRGRGLGLVSMRERLQLVKGDFSAKSEPGRGTTICACVPFVQDKQHRSIAV
jgi:PAS domain S-box-containing protein